MLSDIKLFKTRTLWKKKVSVQILLYTLLLSTDPEKKQCLVTAWSSVAELECMGTLYVE